MKYDFQRASMLKRIPAWLCDIILLITLAVGCMAGLSHVLNVDSYNSALNEKYAGYEQEYQVDFAVTAEQYEQMGEEERDRYDAAAKAMAQDEELKQLHGTLVNLTLLMWSLGLLVPFMLLEFAVPLWLKNGQTIGKKVFGVALMRKDGVKVTPFMMFARAILGKYTIETMIPVLLAVAAFFGIMGLEGFLLCVVFLLAQVIIGMVTRDKTALHDLMACTVAVDLSSQMIFDSVEAMEQYHAELHVDKAFEEQE